jgi:tryptophanyl-tRNA synthetase
MNKGENFSELTHELSQISSIEQIIQNSYNPTLPNLIYSGQGITNDLHIGHYILTQIIKSVQEKLNAKIFFMYSTDEKILQNATTNPIIQERVKRFYDATFTKIRFHDNIKDINSRWYKSAIFFAREIKHTLIPKILGTNYTNLAYYYYTPMQLAPLHYFNKNYNIFILTGTEQLSYFTFANRILKKRSLKLPNYIICRTIPNILMSDKMSSRFDRLAVLLNDSNLFEKIKKSKSYGLAPTLDTLKNDFCYQICLIMNILKEQTKLYEQGYILSSQYKNLVYVQLDKILSKINY